jgi:hypothetical protein
MQAKDDRASAIGLVVAGGRRQIVEAAMQVKFCLASAFI